MAEAGISRNTEIVCVEVREFFEGRLGEYRDVQYIKPRSLTLTMQLCINKLLKIYRFLPVKKMPLKAFFCFVRI